MSFIDKELRLLPLEQLCPAGAGRRPDTGRSDKVMFVRTRALHRPRRGLNLATRDQIAKIVYGALSRHP